MAKKEQRGRLYAVSNAHLDTQWNWTVEDSIRDSLKNTLDYNFKLFEKYPSYVFNFEGAFRYKLMKEYYPRKYARMKKYVKEGRWNPVGAAWDAMDVNVPSGESLIRQILLGNNYFEKEFGKLSKDIFLPDCFGFRASLPSIEAHMGLIGFSTQKLVWGAGSPLLSPDGKVLPPMPKSMLPRLDLGRWIGPDGKGVFVSLLEGNYTYNFDGSRGKKDDRPIEEREEIKDAIEHNRKYSGVPYRSMYYGTGDYGGSCTDGSARLLQEAVDRKAGDFDVIVASPTQIFEDLTEKEAQGLPVYEGGLLIPHGFGAMTSHTAMKRLNRKNETLADRTERAATAAKYLAGEPYPKDRINEAYKTYLWHQFHDDLTGTSIAPAYEYSHSDELLALNVLSGEYANALSAVAARMNTKGTGKPYIVFNPSAFARKAVVSIPFTGEKATVYAGSKRLPTVVADGAAIFEAELAPASFTVFHLREESRRFASGLSVKKTLLENDNLRVRVDRRGNVVSIFDKKLGKELLSAPVEFEIYPDSSTVWPSWEYTLKDLSRKPKTLPSAEKVEIVDRRPVWVGLKITKKFGESSFETLVKLENSATKVLFENRVCWFERASNLFVRFPLTAENEYTLFDSDPGEVKGGVTDSEPYYVHNVHYWADQKDASGAYGVLISNDCKYAMLKKDRKTLSLGLIHTPKGDFMPESGQDFQDLGLNIFSFAIEGYADDRTDAIKNVEAFNNPVAVVETSAHKGAYKQLSFLELTGKGALLTAVKEEEKGDLLILRVRETEGKKEKGLKISLPLNAVENVYECDGYERIGDAVKCGEDGFTFDLEKYELKTFAVRLRKKTVVRAKNEEIKLTKNAKIFTARKEAAKGKTLPLELLEKKVSSSGVTFTMDNSAKNACAAAAQNLKVPAGTQSVHLLAASKGEKKVFTFLVDGKPFDISVASMFGPFGTVESAVSGSANYVTKNSVAEIYTHTHNEKGEDNYYDLAYLYDVVIPAAGAKKITLPDDKDLLVFSAVAVKSEASPLLTDVLDDYGTSAELPEHKLTVVGCEGTGSYKEGALVRVIAPMIKDDGLFTGFEGEGIGQVVGCLAVVRIGNKDLKIKANYLKLGADLAAGKPCKANHEMNQRESAAHAVDGKSGTKWCGKKDDNGVCTLTVDLEKAQSISSCLIVHAGSIENKFWNTSDYEILTKVKESDPWERAVKVKKNKKDLTVHNFEKRKARFVCLKITSPTRDGDSHARIYSFRIMAQPVKEK